MRIRRTTRTATLWMPLWAAVSSGLLLAGCASTTIDQERLLAAAGFQMKIAQTAEQKANLASLQPQHKLVPHQHESEIRFVYADSKYCGCIYVGTQQAYQRYQKLSTEQQIAQMQEAAAVNASMNWGLWGPFGPWF